MRQFTQRLARLTQLAKWTAATALLVGAALAGGGCASSSSDPNASRYQFPGENGTAAAATAPEAAPAPAPTTAQAPEKEKLPTGPTPPGYRASRLRIGDMVIVSFSDVPPPGLLEVRARVPDDGMLTLHYNVRVKAAGISIPDLEKDIRNAYVPRLFRNLTAIVRTEERGDYYVGGEVKLPSRLPLRGEMTVLRAIDSAGGFTEFANRNKIELRRQDGTKFTLSEKKINKGEAVDLPVMPDDHITVRRRLL